MFVLFFLLLSVFSLNGKAEWRRLESDDPNVEIWEAENIDISILYEGESDEKDGSSDEHQGDERDHIVNDQTTEDSASDDTGNFYFINQINVSTEAIEQRTICFEDSDFEEYAEENEQGVSKPEVTSDIVQKIEQSACDENGNTCYFNQINNRVTTQSVERHVYHKESSAEFLDDQDVVDPISCHSTISGNQYMLRNLGIVGSLCALGYWCKIKYNVYQALRSCAQTEKWSVWKPMQELKALAASNQLESLLAEEIEAAYATRAHTLNIFFIDVGQELQAIDAFFKLCSKHNTWLTKLFLPDEQVMFDLHQKQEVLLFLKHLVHSALAAESDPMGNSVAFQGV